MKKILAVLMIIAMMMTTCAALAEEPAAETTAEKLAGLWYVNFIVSEGRSYDISLFNNDRTVIEFNEDTTGIIYTTGDPETKGDVAWREDEDGTIWFMESSMQKPMKIEIGEDYVRLGDPNSGYILNRTDSGAKTFAKTITAAGIEDFNGNYAVTYVAGNGYTMSIDVAMEFLKGLGIASTGINIQNGSVEFLGGNAANYAFDAVDGTLNKTSELALSYLNIKIFKLADGGIAANWMDTTFYAFPVTE